MNERIRELSKESGITLVAGIDSWGNVVDPHIGLQKFAELIIKEVLAVQEQLIAEGHNAWHVNKPTREHFGVE